ncbi:Retinaldehyde-binding protein 1 [Folsomia candida]|uniref:Retinaldehyde-binding protein 1 n=1 Tax=Folsomia candida TaxID=158441 RepID=A0A226D8A6_FOLCA|nr:Retinaldehyde-binding protein 1 [Folsomia candida]
MDPTAIALCDFKGQIAKHDLSRFKCIFDDQLLLGFLNGKKFDVSSALGCLNDYVYVRTTKHQTWTKTNLLPSVVTFPLGKRFNILKNKDVKGNLVVIDSGNLWHTTSTTYDEILTEMLFVADELIRTYLVDSESNEVTLICDGEGLSIRHSLIRTPSRVMKMMDLLLVFIHPNLHSLYEHVPKSILPAGIGGALSNEEAIEEDLGQRIEHRDEFYRLMFNM